MMIDNEAVHLLLLNDHITSEKLLNFGCQKEHQLKG